ncbi:nucleotidyltransferase family protein [Micromonospora phytophila]|uniref:nucleotidyltransferase family protein n=1 Tax=Micromonospora phytophila TaxID=709888 RepID=UPI002030561B|nr:nucleotidyltransferase family protein [Micromonospora phytophila]MCM0673575.1 nucleotidyltransferase family protein [Micromonospora phytophila]
MGGYPMSDVTEVAGIVLDDPLRRRIVTTVEQLGLPDCWIAAGFVRNAVWDHLHGYDTAAPVNDIDVVYFDTTDSAGGGGGRAAERTAEIRLAEWFPGLPFSVKNQARMHLRNGHDPYRSTADAVSWWPETCTAVGIANVNKPRILAPYGLSDLLRLVVRPTSGDPETTHLVRRRTLEKQWLQRWPKLTVETASADRPYPH